jgi:hypothetical protein
MPEEYSRSSQRLFKVFDDILGNTQIISNTPLGAIPTLPPGVFNGSVKRKSSQPEGKEIRSAHHAESTGSRLFQSIS